MTIATPTASRTRLCPCPPDLVGPEGGTKPTISSSALHFAESLDLPVVLERVAQRAAALFGGVCRVCFAPPGRPADARQVVAAPGTPPSGCERPPAGEPYAALLARLGDQGRPWAPPPGDGAPAPAAELLLAPLLARGRRVGMVEVLLPACAEELLSRNAAALRELADHGALAIDTADRLARLQPAAPDGGPPPPGDEVGRLLTLLAHDLRRPLATLSASVQLIARATKGAAALDRDALARLAELAEAAVAQIETQIDGLAPPSAGPAPGARPAPPVDLVRLARLMANFYQQTTGRHQIAVCAEVPELPGPWARPHIERVLGNLLLNAIKYSPAGGEIRVAVGCEEDALGRWATLRVRDSGIGIPSHDLPRLAQPGYRGRNVGAIPGTGFGLTSVREVVGQYGGTLALQSAVGETTILVRLPLGPGGHGPAPRAHG